MAQFLKGMKVLHRAQSAWGVGHVLAVSEDPPRISAQFPGRPGGPVMLSSRDPALARYRFAPQTPALLADGSAVRVLRQLPGPASDLYRYTVETEGKKPSIHSEADLRAPTPREGPAEQLASGRWGAPEDFQLRSEAVRLDLERRADALGALFASRVYVKPHQVSVAHQVLSAPQPRFVLADEVGLGKTIEAGLVLSGLLHAGLVKRCLVVAPSHLTVQWLAELFHKFNLLFTLVDPAPAATEQELRARLARQGELSAEVRTLLSGDGSAAERIARLFPEDAMLRELRGDALLTHLAESYGLSARLLRNRRAVVGGFTPRRLTKVPVELSSEERDLERECRRALAHAKLPSGAVLASLLRRMGSSPPAVASGLSAAGEKAVAQRALAVSRDSKLEAFHDLLRELGPSQTVRVCAEPRETIEYLRAALARRRIEALAYVGDLSPAERDKMVARFRDPDGPRILLSTELGGEGRNFQHCHVLVNYDLTWSPAAIEQRIGRIDRIGQSREVRIYAFRPEGTLAARVLDVLDEGVGVFTEPVGGVDPVLESVETELLALASSEDPERWEKMTRALAERVSAARAEVARAYDPLLDLRSCDRAALRSLAERGARRIGARLLPSSDAEGALRAVATTLEMRLEAVTIEAAKRVGLAVDVDVDVMPGQVSFSVGPELKVDALAGFDLSQDRTVIGSFRREFAVQHEEHDSFATGHPLVEALFAWVRDGELGRAMVARAHVRGLSGAALDARFLVTLPEPADLAQGARVPSRRAARHLEQPLVRVAVRLDGRGGVRVEDALTAQLDSAKLSAVPAPEGGPPAAFAQAIETGLRVAQEEAQRRLRRIVEAAKSGIAAEQEAATRRLARWLAQSKVDVSDARRLLEAEAKIHEDAAAALDGARLELDQAALVQLA